MTRKMLTGFFTMMQTVDLYGIVFLCACNLSINKLKGLWREYRIYQREKVSVFQVPLYKKKISQF